MTGAALALIGRVVGLFGFKLSGFWAGAIVAGLLAVSVAVYSGFLVHAGYDWAEGKCEAASLRDDNARLTARLAEKDRQIAFINGLAQRDAARAQTAEEQLRKNQEAIDATPANPAQCFTRDMARRVRNVR
jgi:hypothetical protein